MKCLVCHARLQVSYTYQVLGKRYGTLPGRIHVYWCSSCQQSRRFMEVEEIRVKEWAAQWEERRKEWITENARLAQKIYWLTLPTDYSGRKLQEIRRGLIALIERTF